jgi:glycosyltransferase involved in cell wall biosynthesis
MNTSNTPPLFSVVIACYNYGRFLSRAINSVLAQTFKSYEIIVIDDGSTDDTPQVCARYNDKIIYHIQKNSGQSSAYNKGADVAQGSYIYILDADDEMLPDSLATFAEAIHLQPDIEAFFGGYISVSSSGKMSTNLGSHLSIEPYARLNKFLSRKLVGIQNGSAIVKKKVFSKIRFPEGLRNNTDIVFFGLVLANCSAIGINKPVFLSHEHDARVRKNLTLILKTGMAPVEALFSKELMPANLMPLRKIYARQRALSIARMLYLNGDYQNAMKYYHVALSSSPLLIFRPQVIKRYFFSVLKTLSVRLKHVFE